MNFSKAFESNLKVLTSAEKICPSRKLFFNSRTQFISLQFCSRKKLFKFNGNLVSGLNCLGDYNPGKLSIILIDGDLPLEFQILHSGQLRLYQ